MTGFSALLRSDPTALLFFLHALLTFHYPVIYGIISFTALYFYFPVGVIMLVRENTRRGHFRELNSFHPPRHSQALFGIYMLISILYLNKAYNTGAFMSYVEFKFVACAASTMCPADSIT